MSNNELKALYDLCELIAKGWEFPDATAHLCLKYSITSARLIELYDNLED